jgi:hypothetical protein
MEWCDVKKGMRIKSNVTGNVIKIVELHEMLVDFIDESDNSHNIRRCDSIFIENFQPLTPTVLFTETLSAQVTTCRHVDKYKNHAGGILFWYCPSCKQDLGNV